jgi:hypothetical protein
MWKQELTRSKTREFLRAEDSVGPAGTPVTVSVNGITNMSTDHHRRISLCRSEGYCCSGIEGRCRGSYHRFCRRFDRCHRFTIHNGYKQCGRRRKQRRAVTTNCNLRSYSLPAKSRRLCQDRKRPLFCPTFAFVAARRFCLLRGRAIRDCKRCIEVCERRKPGGHAKSAGGKTGSTCFAAECSSNPARPSWVLRAL